MNETDLKDNNGKDGRPAYVAYNGKVYDVSQSGVWAGGTHMARHHAGTDLTDLLPLAPHGEEMLERVQEVGILEQAAPSSEEETKARLRSLYAKFHPHPVSIHFPLGGFFFAALMMGLYLLTGHRSFETSAFYALVFSSLFTPPAIAAGLLSWWLNYDLTLTGIFRNKLIFSTLVLTLSLIALVIRIVSAGVVDEGGTAFTIYAALVFVNVPVIFFVAFNGGKITWPS